MDESQQNGGACEKQLLVLEALDDLGVAGVTEVADHLSLPKSTVHYHLDILEQGRYVVRDSGKYELSLRFLELGERVRRRLPLFDVAKPEIEKLATKTGELALLMVEQRGMGVYVYKSKGENAIDIDAPIGRHAHLHNRAMGKAILAFLPENEVEKSVHQHGLPATTENTITDREDLKAELESIEESGVSFNRQESVSGMRGVAVPILGSGGVLGAMSIAGPQARLGDDDTERELVNLLNRSRNVIELSIQNA